VRGTRWARPVVGGLLALALLLVLLVALDRLGDLQ
jgi:hypothetical protein